MKEREEISNILYQLSFKTKGQSNRLYDFFRVKKENYEAIYPLCKIQQSLFTDYKLRPNSTIFNLGVSINYQGDLNIDLWKKAIEIFVINNPVFRVHFLINNEIVYQGINKSCSVNLKFIDISEEGELKNVDDLIEEIIKLPLNPFSNEFLVRFFVIKLSEQKYCFGGAFSQLIIDAKSTMKFESTFKIYQALAKGIKPNAHYNYDFFNYIFRERQIETNKKELLGFWKLKLKNTNSYENRPISKNGDYTRNKKSQIVSFDHAEKIKGFCRNNFTTIPTYFKLLYSVLLKFYFDIENEFIFYEIRDKRSKSFPDSTGLFIQTFPILIPASFLAADRKIKDLFGYFLKYDKETRHVSSTNYSDIVDLLREHQSKFIFNYVSSKNIEFSNDVENIRTHDSSEVDEFYFYIQESTNNITMELGYYNHMFEETCFLERMVHISEQISSGIVRTLGDIKFILPEEYEKTIYSFNSTETAFPNEKSYAELFDETLKLSENSTALVYQDRIITYDFLNQMACKVSSYLIEVLNIKVNVPVIIFMERTEYLSMVILGLLRVGAVYVPIDPKTPLSRLELIVNDVVPETVITHNIELSDLKCNVIEVDEILKYEAGTNPAYLRKVSAEDIAYLIYTSGSTGKPKGTLIKHIGMINHLYSKINLLNITNKSIIIQNSSISFDISIWQLLSCLLTGGQTVIIPDNKLLNISDFINEVGKSSATLLEVVPSYLTLFLDIIEEHKKNTKLSLNYLIVTGEELLPGLSKKWFKHFKSIKLVNAYGPTEASDDITHYIFSSETEILGNVPIGKPVQNMNIYILDTNSAVTPLGFKGEICVSGVGVSKGYLNEIEKTNDVFILDSFQPEKKLKMYKTGDIGRFLANGNIEFFGRKDSQIKLNGNRIELGEIENVLNSIMSIDKAVVLFQKEENSLVAFITGKNVTNFSPSDIRNKLRKVLPEYMIPYKIYPMESFPLTPNGKIDNRKLFEKEFLSDKITDNTNYVEPKDPLEIGIANIWKEILEKENVGLDDNFFDLGGNSMAMLRVNARLEYDLGIEIETIELFEYPTISSLYQYLNSKSKSQKQDLELEEGVNRLHLRKARFQ